MKLILWLCLVLNFTAYSQVEIPEETFLLQGCGKQDLLACEKLGAYYLSKSEWEKANMIGDALCKKDVAMGCTFAGSALMSLGKLKEANVYLMQACDKFEALGCRSLGRLMNKAGEKALANMYFKRACFYGLKEICGEVKDSKQWYSPAALTLLDTINRDCRDSQAADCNTDFSIIKTCAAPLTKQDCLLLAGQLSIYFRA